LGALFGIITAKQVGGYLTEAKNLTEQLQRKINNTDKLEARVRSLEAELADLTKKLTDSPAPPVIDLFSKPHNLHKVLGNISSDHISSVSNLEFLKGMYQGKTGRRSKRSPLVLISGLLGTFMGLYNTLEVNKLKAALAQQQGQVNMLIQVTNEHSQILREVATSLDKLTSVMEAFIAHNPTRISDHLNEQVAVLEGRVRQVLNAMQQLQHRRLAVDLLSSDQLAQMHQSLVDIAQQNRVTLLPKHTSDYFQLETSYLQDGSNIQILIHVPCINPDNILTIYRYLAYPYPLPAKLQYSEATIQHTLFNLIKDAHPVDSKMTVANNAPFLEALFIEPEADYIAVGKDQQYRLLTSGDLALCTKRSKMFLCNEHQVLRHDMDQSCLGSLYKRNEIGAKLFCKVRKEKLREMVYQISATEHLVFSPQPFTGSLKCRNGSFYPFFLSQNDKLTVPSGCNTRLKSHSIFSDFSLDLSPAGIRFKWHWDPLQLPSSLLDDASKTDIQIQQLHNSLLILTNATSHQQVISEIVSSHLANPSAYHWSWWTFIGIVASILILVFILYFMYFRCCGSSSAKPYHHLLPVAYRAEIDGKQANAQVQARCRHGQLPGLCC